MNAARRRQPDVSEGNSRRKVIPLLLSALIPVLLYSFALRIPMMGEDHFGLQALARQLYTVDGTQRIDVVIDPKVVAAYPQTVPWWTSPDAKLIFLRPLTNSVTRGEYLLWGPRHAVTGLHLTNVLAYGFCGMLLFLVGRLLFQRDGVALLAVLIFCCQPYNTIVVPWIAEKASILSLCFVLLGIYLHIRYRLGERYPWELAAWVCFLLAFLAKESGSHCLIVYFLYDVLVWRKEVPERWPGIIRLGLYYAALSIPLFLFLAYFALGGYGVKGFYSIFDEKGPLSAALAYMAKNVLLYASGLLFFVPGFHKLNLELLTRPVNVLFTLVGLALAFGLFYPGVRKRFLGDRKDLLLVIWILVALLPTLQLIVQDRYLYAATPPFGLFMASYLWRAKETRAFGRLTQGVFYALIGFYVFLPATGILALEWVGSGIQKLYGYQRQVVSETRAYLGKTDQPVNVFYLNLPNAILTFALQYDFDFQGSKGEVRAFPLAISPEVPEVAVLNDHSIRITSRPHPLLESEPERLFMTDSLNQVGLGRTNRYFRATVEGVEGGHIYSIRFDFAAPLDDPSMRFFYVKDGHVHPAAVFRDAGGKLQLKTANVAN